MVSMAVFYWLFEVKGWRKLAFPLVVIGRNSIFIYLAASIIPFGTVAGWLVGGQTLAWLGSGQGFVKALVVLFLEWLVLYILYRRKIFVKL